MGICVGMQLLCTHSEERDTQGIGVFDVLVKRFPSSIVSKIPQIGWNDIYKLGSPLFNGIQDHSYIYYVHSYYAELSKWTIATSEYGLPYSAALQKDNFYGVQFHTEKSAGTGEQILRNFIELK